MNGAAGARGRGAFGKVGTPRRVPRWRQQTQLVALIKRAVVKQASGGCVHRALSRNARGLCACERALTQLSTPPPLFI